MEANPTVKELIAILEKMDPDAVVCSYDYDVEDDETTFSTFEICKEFDNVSYINDAGDEVTGKIVTIY